MDSSVLAWIGIAFCVTQSAMFSGLNLAFFDDRRIITSADILGRLLRGISRRADWQFAAAPPRTEGRTEPNDVDQLGRMTRIGQGSVPRASRGRPSR